MWTFQHAVFVNKTNIISFCAFKYIYTLKYIYVENPPENQLYRKLVSSALKQMLDMSITPLLISIISPPSPKNKVP